MGNTTRQLPELLAPAGNLTSAITAYDNGADAVYAGLGRFNAREMGDNFTYDDMSRLSAYAKKRGKLFYITLNTLVKETELELLGETIEKIAHLEPDAVIVQDIGVVRILREYFPSIEIHASTQMGIHNSAGVQVCQDMGIERVILERQVTMDELETIMGKTNLEIEVFVHGALCACLSGNCLFSSWIGGWSGNRGRCKQPCRRRFHFSQSDRRKSGFFFSTQDLYSLDLIGDLKRLGVASLKIEGRLKKPDYVKNVVSAYRMVLDAPADREKRVLNDAKNVLAGSYGRKWSHGFATTDDMNSLINHTSMGVSGLLVGSVAGVKPRGFTLSLSRKIRIGDRLRIQPKSGDEGPAVTITKMTLQGRKVPVAREGNKVFIHCDKEIPQGGMVYKIGESTKGIAKNVEKLPLFVPKSAVDLVVNVTPQGISVSVPGTSLTWTGKQEISEAKKHPLTAETVDEAFRVTRTEDLKTGNITINIEGNFFLPASTLKSLRRDFWEWFIQQDVHFNKDSENKVPQWREIIRSKAALPSSKGEKTYFTTPDTKEQIPGSAICLQPFYNYSSSADELILPHFVPEQKLGGLNKGIRRAYEKGIRRFRLTSLFQLDLFGEYDDVILTASYPLPVVNSPGIQELAEKGVTKAQAWLELEKEALEKLAGTAPLPVEIYRYGRPPLLATRAKVEVEGKINDSRGKTFYVEKDPHTDIYYIYPDQVMEIPAISGTANLFDFTHAIKGEEKTTDFNFTHELM